MLVAFLFARPLIRRLAVETDPGWELVWNVLLALVVVGVMAAAIPKSS